MLFNGFINTIRPGRFSLSDVKVFYATRVDFIWDIPCRDHVYKVSRELVVACANRLMCGKNSSGKTDRKTQC